MRSLNGRELAGFIKERQLHQVRGLRQAAGIIPKLAIIMVGDNPVSAVYVNLKKRYGADIGVEVDILQVQQAAAIELIKKLNADDSVHGIIVQLPLPDPSQTEAVVQAVAPYKDVDGLGLKPDFEPATPLAILWVLSGYNIELQGKQVVLVGRGKLVGAPLERMLQASGVNTKVVVKETPPDEARATILAADIVITATGHAGVIQADMLKEKAVVVDAGVASEGGKTVGDVAPEVYEQRDDLTITPVKGGVGPLTVCALFDNVIRSARRVADAQQPTNSQPVAD